MHDMTDQPCGYDLDAIARAAKAALASERRIDIDPATVLALVARARRAEEMERERETCAEYLTWQQGFQDGQRAASKDRNSIP